MVWEAVCYDFSCFAFVEQCFTSNYVVNFRFFLLFLALHLLCKSSFSLHFKTVCVLARVMGFLDTACWWVLTFYPICQSVSFDWAFSPFTFRVNIVMYKFDPAFWCLLVVLPISWPGFFIVLMVFTIWCVFGVTGTCCSFLCLVLLSGALTRQAWWWWNLLAVTCS